MTASQSETRLLVATAGKMVQTALPETLRASERPCVRTGQPSSAGAYLFDCKYYFTVSLVRSRQRTPRSSPLPDGPDGGVKRGCRGRDRDKPSGGRRRS